VWVSLTQECMRRKNAITNPNGANQWVADPRQQLFLAYYLDPKSKTFSNALQSAIKAGFTQQYAEAIMSKMPDWLAEKVGNISPMLLRAERNLGEALDYPTMTQAMSMFGPIYEKKEIKVRVKNKKGKTITKTKKVNGDPVLKHNLGLIKIKQDVSMFVAERTGRAKWGKDADPSNVFNFIVFANDQLKRVATRVIAGGDDGGEQGEESSD